ncbi:MAG TPA: PIN domain nuclease [Nitrospirae bacterium]|nr:PIN domain nuclease [Nitrospirota bacterium]
MNTEKFLIDTSIWVKYLRGMDESVRDRLSTLVLKNCAYTTDIIIMEILRGAKSEKEYKMLYNDFLALPELSINKEVWELSWRNAYKLRKKGLNIPMADVIIASTAAHYDCTLIHSDRHFPLTEKHLNLKTIKM